MNSHPTHCGHGWALDVECWRCGDDPLPERAVVELRAAKDKLRAIRSQSPTMGGPYGERVSNEGLNRLEASMRDEGDFTEDGAMVAYKTVLNVIADLRDLRDIRGSTLAIGRHSGIEEAVERLEKHAAHLDLRRVDRSHVRGVKDAIEEVRSLLHVRQS